MNDSGADGSVLWRQRYDGPANSEDDAWAMAMDGSGNVMVTGSSVGFDSSGNTISDGYTVRYASAYAASLWEKRLAGPASSCDSSHCLALGPNGMVVVTGSSLGCDGNAHGGYATVACREVPEVVSINPVHTGVRLRFSGIPGRTYNTERAPVALYRTSAP